MDAHYHKVMNARNSIQDTGSKLYFAYSGVLDAEAFEAWKEEHSYSFFHLPDGMVAEALDLDLTFDFPSRWWGGRVAGLKPSPGNSVWGKLFEIEAKNWPVVQHKEGVVTGMSIEIPVKIKIEGKIIEATAFTTNPQRQSLEGPVSAGYVEALVRGAKSSGLPQKYIDSIPTKAL